MPAAHQDALLYLFLFVGVLMAVIIGTLIFSQLKRKPSSGVKTDQEQAAAPSVPSSESAKTFSGESEDDVDLKEALHNTEENFFGRLKAIFASQGANAALEDIEEVLYTSDLGPQTVRHLMETLEERLSHKDLRDPESLRAVLRERLMEIFENVAVTSSEPSFLPLKIIEGGTTVIMIVGVNGAGKTTSIGKIAARAATEGLKVLVAAGDTFRAAAGAQLKAWSDRAQVEIFAPEGVTDPAAVAFDAVAKAKAQGMDLVLIDTAGRLHTQANLMEELKKVKRVIQRQDPQAPHEILIVLDANSGQNALVQAKEFHQALGLTGAILTKMDGTAKGGVAVGLVDGLAIPVKMIGVGERVRDLRAFSAAEYVDSILGI